MLGIFRVYVKYLLLILFLLSINAQALCELGFDFNYNRQVYGLDMKNKLTNRTYLTSLAIYIFSTTALEINYSNNTRITTENNDVAITGSTFKVSSVQNTVDNKIYGVGIRQALLPSTFRFRPMVSIGYARRFTQDSTHYTFHDTSTGNSFGFTDGPVKIRDDSVFAAFILQWRLAQTFSIKGSMRTVFPAFQTARAKDYVEYMAGLSWFF